MGADSVADRALVAAAAAGERAATEPLLRRIADTIWTACRLLTREEADARQAFAEVAAQLQADRFRRLQAYRSGSSLDTFIALVTRELLAQRLVRLLQDDAGRGWRAFEHFFQADFQRLIRRRLPGLQHEEARRDAYQEICVALLDKECRRLKAHSGSGSFAGFVLQTVDRLLVDFIRSFSLRRRAPAAITRLEALDQEIFRLVHWQGAEPDAGKLAIVLATRVQPAPGTEAVAAALQRVQRALPGGYGGAPATRIISLSDAPELSEEGSRDGPSAESPEQIALERERESLLSSAASALRAIAATMSEEERLYLRIALAGAEPLAAREVARLMRRPVGEVYKLKQRVMKQLKDALQDDEAVKKWRVSV